jgi:hypothetical protein
MAVQMIILSARFYKNSSSYTLLLLDHWRNWSNWSYFCIFDLGIKFRRVAAIRIFGSFFHNVNVFGLDLKYTLCGLKCNRESWEPKNFYKSCDLFIDQKFYVELKKVYFRGSKVKSKAIRLQKRNIISHEIFISRVTYPSIRNFKLNSKKYTLWGLKSNYKSREPKNLNKF